jgi:hypothetical protein
LPVKAANQMAVNSTIPKGNTSVVDPDPQGSETFCRIRIRNSRLWIRIRIRNWT